jgi:Flp pilus assembly protein TadG
MPVRIATVTQSIAAFRRGESGAFAVMGIFFFMIMAIAAGIAIDITRSEMNRKRMQYAADNAALAAAVVPGDDEAIAEAWDYLTTVGVGPDDAIVEVKYVGSNRKIAITGTAQTDTMFMRLLGEDALPQPFLSGAMADVAGAEVSLVLDISGSMNDGQKLPKLKAAATGFVEDLVGNGRSNTSVSIVPYHAAVNLGEDLARHLPLTAEHDLSHCIRFSEDEYSTTGIPADGVLQRISHYDWQSGNRMSPGLVDKPYCSDNDYSKVMPWSNDEAALKAHINSLQADGWTAIDLAARTGAMLLDPSMQAALDGMVDDRQVPKAFRGRPYDFGDKRTQKVMVILTDGENTDQYDIAWNRKTGPSGVFVHRPVEKGTILLKPDETDEAYSQCIPGTYGYEVIAAGHGETLPAHSNCGGDRGYWPASGDRLPNGNALKWSFGLDSDRRQAPDDHHAPWWQFPRIDDVAEDVARDVDGDGKVHDDVAFSIWSPTKGKFWITSEDDYWNAPKGGSDAVELSYQELFAIAPLEFITKTLLAGADAADLDRFALNTAREKYYNAGKMNRNLQAICDAARLNKITIYTIALEVNEAGEQVMRNCVGEENDGTKYFEAGEDDLSTIFDEISSQIARVRLVE